MVSQNCWYCEISGKTSQVAADSHLCAECAATPSVALLYKTAIERNLDVKACYADITESMEKMLFIPCNLFLEALGVIDDAAARQEKFLAECDPEQLAMRIPGRRMKEEGSMPDKAAGVLVWMAIMPKSEMPKFYCSAEVLGVLTPIIKMLNQLALKRIRDAIPEADRDELIAVTPVDIRMVRGEKKLIVMLAYYGDDGKVLLAE